MGKPPASDKLIPVTRASPLVIAFKSSLIAQPTKNVLTMRLRDIISRVIIFESERLPARYY